MFGPQHLCLMIEYLHCSPSWKICLLSAKKTAPFFVKFCKDFLHANLVWLTPQGPILEKLLDVSKTSDLSIFYCSYTSFLVDALAHTHGPILEKPLFRNTQEVMLPFWVLSDATSAIHYGILCTMNDKSGKFLKLATKLSIFPVIHYY